MPPKKTRKGATGDGKTKANKRVERADYKETFKKKQVGVSDMTMLSKINNEAINDNLKKRFENHEIYTYIGNVLISVNPFKDLGIYTDEILKSYVGKNRLEMPPHVYAVAESAYYSMNSYKENQCIIISGESGAGKTEAAKRIMQYIATVSGERSSSIKEIKDMVLATNPLLESFGCAKTLRNNNSSRHGRVVGQIENERNFHIFYQFTKAASDEYRTQFGIEGPESYLYTNKSGCLDDAMNVIGLTQDEQIDIFRMLSIVLWLGNVTFEDGDDGGSVITDENVTNFIAYIMEVDADTLNKVLTSRTLEVGGRRTSVFDVPLNPVQALAVRDALAKAIYNNLFEWIVERINSALRSRTTSSYVIGVLDIYGFEIFDENSFEQLCINYVNEKLQQIFIELTLKTEQEEYVREKIKWTPISFFNNKVVCDLIEEKRPPGIFAALNDACATAHADSDAADNSFVQRLGSLGSNPHFESRGNKFLIKHYAGDVLYSIPQMTDKNKDQLVKDLLELIATTSNGFLNQLFPHQVNRDNKKRPPTASDKIKSSANSLVNNLMQAQPSYIRTIKPNQNKSPSEYDQKIVLHQIKYLGLNENIRVRRAGFAYRQTFEKFIERFYLLSKKTSYAGECIWEGDSKSGSSCILKECGIATEEWQMGVTKVFIRHPETIWALEHLRDRYWHNMALRIQRAYRNYVRYKIECAIRIQRCWRKNKDQIVYVQLRDSGHEILAGRKERRRFSLISMRKFTGDYLNVGVSGGSEDAIRNACNLGANENVAFSSKIQLLVSRLGRSSRPSPRYLVLTDKSIYLLISQIERKLLTITVERNISLLAVTRVSLSNLRDDWVVLHVNNPTKELGDPIFSCYFKTEFLVHLRQLTGSRINIDITNSIEYTKKINKTANIKFIKDENVKKDDIYKSHTVHVCTGEPANSVSDPPCPRKESPSKPKATTRPKKNVTKPATRGVSQKTPKVVSTSSRSTTSSGSNESVSRRLSSTSQSSSRGSRPAPPPPPPQSPSKEPTYKAKFDFVTEDTGELSFKKDDILEIMQKDDNGWWLAKKDGEKGWVPSNYLEEVKVTPKAVPVPAKRKPPPVAPTQRQQRSSLTTRKDVESDKEPQTSTNSDAGTKNKYRNNASNNSPVAVFPGMASGGVPSWKKTNKAAENHEEAESDQPVTPARPTATNYSGRKAVPSIQSKPNIPTKSVSSKPSSSGERPVPPPRPESSGTKPSQSKLTPQQSLAEAIL
ncbi:9867_t:CDS:10 [Diversispora eburnea]|uniref:9867_t:CDS:1 n=1 Tax=Diversispora eburnea TaxID=1213867 RepID=A0A9N8YLW0_9GLOM|nr:9867_t:CDS:10 [Diversispora eburnea]